MNKQFGDSDFVVKKVQERQPSADKRVPRKSNMQQKEKNKNKKQTTGYFTLPFPISKLLWNFLEHIGGK